MTRWLTFFLLVAPEASSGLDHELGEFNLFLFCFLVIGLIGMAVLIGAGIVTGVFVALTGGATVVSGVALSSSIAAAVSRSPLTGLKWFVIQMSMAGGAVSGFLIGAIYSHLHKMPLWNWQSSGLAALLGAVLSGGIGWTSLKLWLKVWHQLQQWWQRQTPLDSTNRGIPSDTANP